jgi:hypothetical protein
MSRSFFIGVALVGAMMAHQVDRAHANPSLEEIKSCYASAEYVKHINLQLTPKVKDPGAWTQQIIDTYTKQIEECNHLH